jgi:hypothetical protein
MTPPVHFAASPAARTACGAPRRTGWSPFWAAVTCAACLAARPHVNGVHIDPGTVPGTVSAGEG